MKPEKTYFVYNKWCTFIPKCFHELALRDCKKWMEMDQIEKNELPGECPPNTQNKKQSSFIINL